MSKEFRAACPRCSQKMKIPHEAAGVEISCPTCSHRFTSRPVSKPVPVWVWVIIGAVPTLAVFGYVAYSISNLRPAPEPAAQPAASSLSKRVDALPDRPFFLSAEEKQSRDNILRALIKIQAATSVGVTKMKYSDILSDAVGSMSFEKQNLSNDRNRKFLASAALAAQYYADASDLWEHYFQDDFQIEHKGVTFTLDHLKELEKDAGVTSVDYDKLGSTACVVPLNSALGLYWRIADTYIDKLKADR